MSNPQLTFVSSNEQKFAEYEKLLPDRSLRRQEIRVVEPQELSLVFLVQDKVELVRSLLGNRPFFVEHAALSIDSWAGLPGTLIRAFMDRLGPEGICRMMRAFVHDTERKATVSIAIGLHIGNHTEIFENSRNGVIASEPRGERRFSWDRIFVPKEPDSGNEETYAEMGVDKKNAVSARSVVAKQMWTRYQEIVSTQLDVSFRGHSLFDEERRAELFNRRKMLIKRLDALRTDEFRALSEYEKSILKERIEEYEQERNTIEDALAGYGR